MSLPGIQEKEPLEWREVPYDPLAALGPDRTTASTAAQREIFGPSVIDSDASRAYNLSISLRFEGPLDLDSIYSALLNLIDRHEALRGRFSSDGSQFRVAPRLAFSLPLIDVSSEPEPRRQEAYERLARAEAEHLFDLVGGPLFRATLFRHATERWSLVFTCHHVTVDGWSLKIILEDLARLYSELVRATGEAPVALPAPSFLPYVEEAARQERDQSAGVREYWKGVYADGIPVLDLPLDRPRPRQRTYRSERIDYQVGKAVLESLKAAGARQGASLFVTILSAYALYLHRISGSPDLVVGVPAAGQLKVGKARLLGHDARLMPIRSRLEASDTFATFATRMLGNFLSAYEHQWISMPELIAELGVRPQADRVPLVPVMFNFDPGLRPGSLEYPGLRASHFFHHRHFETFELSVNAVIEDGGLILECAFNSDLFEAAEMRGRMAQLEKLMASIGESPDRPVTELELLPAEAMREMDRALNRTEMEYE